MIMVRMMRVMKMMTRLFPRMMRVSTELLDWEVNQGAMDALLDTILAHGAASQDMLQVNHQTCTQPQQVL